MVTGRNEELDEAHDRTIERGYLINLVKNYVFSRDGRFSSFSRDMVLVFNFQQRCGGPFGPRTTNHIFSSS